MNDRDTYDITVAELRRNAAETIVVRCGVFAGKPRVDIRIFADYGDTGEARPTKKGVSLPAERVGELIEALQAAAGTAP
jgi:hypothetical protein